MREVMKVILYTLLPYAVIALVFVIWILLDRPADPVRLEALDNVSSVEVTHGRRVVRRIDGNREIAASTRFVNAHLNLWRETRDRLPGEPRLTVVFSEAGGDQRIVEIRGHLWSVKMKGKTFTRLFTSTDLLEFTEALGFPRPAPEIVKKAQDGPFDRFIRVVIRAGEAAASAHEAPPKSR